MNRHFAVLACLICIACGKQSTYVAKKDAVFIKRTSEETGLQFINQVEPQNGFDVFKYRNFYNGGGVAIADFDNDGLTDVYLTANMQPNKLYRNLGNLKFQDITERAGVKGAKKWSTGVSVADVNADGFLDIYVCNAGDIDGGKRENELFINNGDLTFTERAAEFGLDDNGYSTHAVFFDFDLDGDLDCYVLNNSYTPVSSLGYKNLRHVRDNQGGHKLYRNDNKKFVDISETAGIYGSVIGFGLGASVGDVNNDGWPDIYVSNDLYERDYLYVNNQEGGFDERLEDFMGHISMFSMGGDMADLNNDGYPEIFSTDMLPESDERLKTLIAFETYDVYQLRLQNGYYHQYLRNMLHMNTGNGRFLEIGELAGVAATDWSWGSLIADFNNDGNKEIFVSNGIYKDIMDQDFVENLGRNEQIKKLALEGKKVDFGKYLKDVPSVPLSNYLFENQGDWQFENQASKYGLDEPGFSNGAAYGDLDNDGDLDLIVNNVNQDFFLYQNQTAQKTPQRSITITFNGAELNKFGIGTTVRVFANGGVITHHQMPNRGFQSSVDFKMVIGLGELSQIDSMRIEWPDRKAQTLTNVPTGHILQAEYHLASLYKQNQKSIRPILKLESNHKLEHYENRFNDFDRDRLQYHMLSTQGPAFAKADLNVDGLDDVFLGGSIGHSSQILFQKRNGDFEPYKTKLFESDSLTEDTDCAFFDADNDGDLDLYVATGSVEYTGASQFLLDRFYLNAGTKQKPEFQLRKLENKFLSGSCVRPADFDSDGDIDLFVGSRVIPGKYGLPASQLLLVNDGKGRFTDGNTDWAPELKALGMVTDALWADVDEDGLVDLLVVGEWMPVTLFKNTGTRLVKQLNYKGLEKTDGWWNVIRAADVDADGDQDFILGNNGRNSRFKPKYESPLLLYVNDFDKNGSTEPLFAFVKQNKPYTLALRQDIIKQMSSMRKEFVLYQDYADKSMSEIFGQDLLDETIPYKFYEANSSVLMNKGLNGFDLKPLPFEAQLAPVYGIEVYDVNQDGNIDILLGGNLFSVKPEVGRYDALRGLVLLGNGNGKGEFKSLTASESGLDIEGEVRHVSLLNNKFVFIRNNASAVIYSLNR